MLFFFNDTATTEIYTLSLHDALPISSTRGTGRGNRLQRPGSCWLFPVPFTLFPALFMPRYQRTDRINEQLRQDRKSTRLNSSHANISYAVFCLKKKTRHLSLPISHNL